MKDLKKFETQMVNGGVAPLIWFGAGVIYGYMMK